MKSLRLETIASMVNYDTVFDVGADHGELEVILSRNEAIKKIYAVENKKGPFEALKNKIDTFNLTKVEALFSSGINDLPAKKLSLVIAGMGGINIVNILLEDKAKLVNVEELVLAPQSDYELVRRVLVTLGYRIDKEEDITENEKDYLITRFVKGEAKFYDNYTYEYGLNADFRHRKHLISIKRHANDSKKFKEKVRKIENEN